MTVRTRIVVVACTLVALLWPGTAAVSAGDPAPDFGSSVHIFNPAMGQPAIQAELDSIAAAQVNNEFGARRDAVLFLPGTYGSSSKPLNFQVGYYTTVAGLGRSPDDVVINGSIDVFDRCLNPDGTNCVALVNFWRSMSNLRLNVVTPRGGCRFGEFWAVSQAAPMRRVHVNGLITLMDYCLQPAFASGGFIADSEFDNSVVINGSQQQWITRNSKVDFWTNDVWNQVFSGVVGAPHETTFPHPAYTVLATSPVTREAPYLYVDAAGQYEVFVPAVRHDSAGTSWASGPTAGRSIPISKFFVASPGDSASRINSELARGQNLILTPGVYNLDKALRVKRPDAVVLGLGMATLVPQDGNAAVEVANEPGILVSGLILDAGAQKSDFLLQVGTGHEKKSDAASDPAGLYDVFFRVGGPALGKVDTALVVNGDNVILDDVWAWRADHGHGVGWTSNTSDTGVIVNGDNVTAYGLFVEHFQKFNVIWKGNGGTDIFFQNELPYDVPSQAAWMEAPGVDGYAAFKVAGSVTSFHGFGMGSYSFFNQGIDIFADHAFEAPATLPAGSLHDLLTIFLDPTHGKGGILHVVNNVGGSSTAANPDQAVAVVNYP